MLILCVPLLIFPYCFYHFLDTTFDLLALARFPTELEQLLAELVRGQGLCNHCAMLELLLILLVGHRSHFEPPAFGNREPVSRRIRPQSSREKHRKIY
jgi:hypothetical protein